MCSLTAPLPDGRLIDLACDTDVHHELLNCRATVRASAIMRCSVPAVLP